MNIHKFKSLVACMLLVLTCSCKKEVASWIVPSVECISEYKNFPKASSLKVSLAHAETEHFQLAFEGSPNETFTITRETETEKLLFNARRIEKVLGYEDALVPCQGSITLTDSVAKLWLSFTAQQDLPSGIYNEVIRIHSDQKNLTLNVEVQVYDPVLPLTPSIPATFGIISRNLTDSLLPTHTEANKLRWAELCLSYRMNPYFSTWLEGTMRHEASSSPFPWNDERSRALLTDPRYNRFAVPFHALSGEELKEMLQQLETDELLNKAYFYLWDEPCLMDEYAQIKKYAEQIHALSPQAKVLTTFFCGPKDGPRKEELFAVFDLWKGDTQIYSMSAWALQNEEANADTCRSLLTGNDEWWTYVCMGPNEKQPNLLLEMTGYQHRAVMWRNWKERTTGFLYWAVNAYAEEPGAFAFRKDLPAGDGVLIYPGELLGCDEPIVSIRMERWRDSMEEYEILHLLEQKLGRAKVESLFAVVYKGPSEYTSTYSDIQKFRNTAFEMLKKN